MLTLVEPSAHAQRRFSALRATLKERTAKEGFVFHGDKPTLSPIPYPGDWLANIKKLLLTPSYVLDVARAFHAVYQPNRSFNVAALETGGIPLATAIALEGAAAGLDVRPLIVRKSRNKRGLRQIIEGDPLLSAPFILVDDVLNSGKSLETLRQRIADIGGAVACCFAVIDFKNPRAIHWANHFRIPIVALLSLDDFGLALAPARPPAPERLVHFETLAAFKTTGPATTYVNPKSTPAVDASRVYFGADDGVFYALDRETLRPSWTVDTGYRRKGIWSSPVLHDGSVMFGAYSGEFFRVDAKTGETIWRSRPADFIGGSPAIDDKTSLVFVGCEHELRSNLGSLTALDIATGEPIWRIPLTGYTHTPGYSTALRLVAIGSNDGEVILAHGPTGKLIWTRHLPGAVKHKPVFCSAPPTMSGPDADLPSPCRPLLAVPCHDGKIYVLDVATGDRVFTFAAEFASFAAPLVIDDRIYFTSCDQNLYRASLTTGQIDGHFYAGSRIMSAPVLINEKIYFGTNAGSIFEIDPRTLTESGWCNLPDRVTSDIVPSPDQQTLYVHTNEDRLFAMRRIRDPQPRVPTIVTPTPTGQS